MNITWLDRDIFTLSEIFSAEECLELIARGEGMGFEAASVTTPSGPQMLPSIRNNDRVIFDDPAFAHTVWNRVQEFVPNQIDGYAVKGLNERFRFYRYDPGQRFKRHKDGRVLTSTGEISRLSFLIYLNTDYEGGETVFRHYTYHEDRPVSHEIRILPQVGMGLFFIHERKHEGSPVLSGRKYLLRTDVLYSGAPEEEEAES